MSQRVLSDDGSEFLALMCDGLVENPVIFMPSTKTVTILSHFLKLRVSTCSREASGAYAVAATEP